MVTIHMPLLNEGTDVWIPVPATLLSPGIYRIDGEASDGEEWKFQPGTVVRCAEKTFSGGKVGLAAVEPA